MFERITRDIKNIFEEKDSFSHYLGLSINIYRDWVIISMLFFITILLSSVWGYKVFFGNQGLLDTSPTSGAPFVVKLDVTALHRSVVDWRAKELEFDKRLDQKVLIVDPSL